MPSIALLTVDIDASIRSAMQAIDKGACSIALVVDHQACLVGVVTDGDVRRALLAGAELDSPLGPCVQRHYTWVAPTTSRAEVLDLMRARSLNQVPIVDDAGRVVGLHLLRDIIGGTPRTNWAVIMAGGKGTRLGSITERIPKPMIKVAGRPILERLVLNLVGFGIRTVFLSVNHLAPVIEEHFGNGSKFGCSIHYLKETVPLGTGGSLSLLPQPASEPVIVMNGDLITEVNIDRLLRFHVCGHYMATIAVRPYFHQVPFGCVQLEGEQIMRIQEKPVLSQTINTGIYVLNPQLLTSRQPEPLPITRIFEQCIRRGDRVGAYQMDDEWADVGLPQELLAAKGLRPSDG